MSWFPAIDVLAHVHHSGRSKPDIVDKYRKLRKQKTAEDVNDAKVCCCC